ncbi:MAG: hypothetical protein ABJZ55_11450 [Fuerstiella sp.]
MTRRNHTILFATVVMVSISGCSGGKLKNLLSRNDYQSLEELDAGQPGLPDGNKTQVVSAKTDENKSFFRLPGFLKGDDESSVIAPDPFIDSTTSATIDSKVAEYRAKVDERIARQAEAAKTTLADVESQAKDLFEKSKNRIDDPFAAFAESKPEETQSNGEANSTEPQEDTSFAEMFGEQSKPEMAQPLIAAATDNPFDTPSPPESEMSEFDKLLQAHQQQTPDTANQMTIAPAEPKADNIFAELDQPAKSQPEATDFFGEEFATNAVAEKASSGDSFDSLMNGQNVAESADDIWMQLDNQDDTQNGSSMESVFGSDFPAQEKVTDAAEISFGEDFQQTASRHGFSENNSTWGSVTAESNQDQPVTLLAPPEEHQFNNAPLVTHVGDGTHNLNSASAPASFFPASQSQSAEPVSAPMENQGMGLIIPASDSSDGNRFTDFESQPSKVQQISATQVNPEQNSVAAASIESDMNLFEDADMGPAVQAVKASEGWASKTWFLIIGCVLIAGLLFLPERQKR